VVLIDFLEKGTTINSQDYVKTLEKLCAWLHCMQKDLDPIPQHDSARPHTNRETQEPLQRLQLKEVLLHLLYSPYLAACDFHTKTQDMKILYGKIQDTKMLRKISIPRVHCAPFGSRYKNFQATKCLEEHIVSR
ncbi:hypothetical protein JRQ81_006977, partial [Phrynocephalus forsythii]